ncbi:hypothetical protein [Pontibacter vulgaris]|uniref:hypothetical protein n=1 Tax=Pontibacter vulgaris TaxID=2905679 RepID=UPI001FA70263|nr:hypothetical protein [Pontibacter vulgaris]
MILYSGLITLKYDPATDILETEMPNVSQFTLPEVRSCLDIIISHIHNYHITKALFDSRGTQLDIGENDEEYKALAAKFGADLITTKLRKVARLALADKKREKQGQKLQESAKETLTIRTFSSYPEAMNWLQKK